MNHDLRHCDDPGCCTGVLVGTCHRCKQESVFCNDECPGVESAPMVQTVLPSTWQITVRIIGFELTADGVRRAVLTNETDK